MWVTGLAAVSATEVYAAVAGSPTEGGSLGEKNELGCCIAVWGVEVSSGACPAALADALESKPCLRRLFMAHFGNAGYVAKSTNGDTFTASSPTAFAKYNSIVAPGTGRAMVCSSAGRVVRTIGEHPAEQAANSFVTCAPHYT